MVVGEPSAMERASALPVGRSRAVTVPVVVLAAFACPAAGNVSVAGGAPTA